MAYDILAPENSFVQFAESNAILSCEFAPIELCLPFFDEDDVSFQFKIIADSEAEADALCDLDNNLIQVGVVFDCDEPFAVSFSQKPERFRISPLQVLYNWQHGLPGIVDFFESGECFKIKVIVDESNEFCSNCFQKIGDDCHTSVIEYGNDDNFAGFNYCNSAPVNEDEAACEATIIAFTNETNLAITYTTSMQDKYGNFPSVEVWGWVGSELVRMYGIEIKFDTYPPTQILIDMGGNLSGIVKIK